MLYIADERPLPKWLQIKHPSAQATTSLQVLYCLLQTETSVSLTTPCIGTPCMHVEVFQFQNCTNHLFKQECSCFIPSVSTGFDCITDSPISVILFLMRWLFHIANHTNTITRRFYHVNKSNTRKESVYCHRYFSPDDSVSVQNIQILVFSCINYVILYNCHNKQHGDLFDHTVEFGIVWMPVNRHDFCVLFFPKQEIVNLNVDDDETDNCTNEYLVATLGMVHERHDRFLYYQTAIRENKQFMHCVLRQCEILIGLNWYRTRRKVKPGISVFGVAVIEQ